MALALAGIVRRQMAGIHGLVLQHLLTRPWGLRVATQLQLARAARAAKRQRGSEQSHIPAETAARRELARLAQVAARPGQTAKAGTAATGIAVLTPAAEAATAAELPVIRSVKERAATIPAVLAAGLAEYRARLMVVLALLAAVVAVPLAVEGPAVPVETERNGTPRMAPAAVEAGK